MANEKVEVSRGPKPITVLVSDLFPGVFVLHNGKPQQIRVVSLHGSRGVSHEMKSEEYEISYTVVFCDENGDISTESISYDTYFEVYFVEVFEPSIPAGYVSRKNFKKCYEDALASVDGVTSPRTVNIGDKWRAKRTLASAYLQAVPEGTTCVVYSKDTSSCRLMLPNGGDLGNIGVEALRSDFYYVEDKSSCLVKLTYYKPSGKYYSDGHYVTKQTTFHRILDEIYDKLISGDNPGLGCQAVLRNDFTTSVFIADDDKDVPHVITAQAICAEIARRSTHDPVNYARSLSSEAVGLYERHHRSIGNLLPLDFIAPPLGVRQDNS